MLGDNSTVQQVLGCLCLKPQLLSQVDKYNLTVSDFSTRFFRYIYSAVYGLYAQGASKIEPIDIANYLESDSNAKISFEQNHGVEYVQDAKDFSDVQNFDYYYNRLKKINLLRDLSKQGFDISDYYCDDLTSPRATEINQKFETLTTKDICDGVKRKLLHLEADYAKSEEVQVESAFEGMEALINDISENVSIGLPLQGHIYSRVVNGAEPGALYIRSASSGTGKAIPNSERIPTPDGWKVIGDIKEGDYVFDAFGKPTKVLQIFPQGLKDVWIITFKDGRTVRCCKEHLWSYNTPGQKKSFLQQRRFVTKELQEIIKEPLQGYNGQYMILVPQQYAVEYSKKEHYLPPYVFGTLLGDGSFRQQPCNKSLQFSSETSEIPNYIGDAMGWIVKRSREKNYTWYFSTTEFTKMGQKINVWVEEALQEYPELINAKSEDKYVPRDYLEDSIENRYELLNGLLDTGGSVDEKGRISYWTVSEQLSKDVVELCQSLGFKTHVTIDTHKDSLPCYCIHITGRPEDKLKLFRLKRKKERIENWFNITKRKEANTHNPIIKIEQLNYQEEMTCFIVDNAEHLFLVGDFVPTHNTRSAVADACYLAYPVRFDGRAQQWVQNGSNERVLFIITEQTYSQIRKMILAYLTDINESRFKFSDFGPQERQLITQALKVMEKYRDNFIIIKMPNPTIELLKMMIRENCLTHDISAVFFDYIFINPALLHEFGGASLRNDEILALVSAALKDLAVELNVPVFTSTQVNASADDNRNIRNEASLAGGRATINKADNGAIMARPTKDELDSLASITSTYGIPNIVTDIFKVRSGEWSQVRIWSRFNLGTLKRQDLFITDARLDPIEGFFEGDTIVVQNWDDEKAAEFDKFVKELNDDRLQDNN